MPRALRIPSEADLPPGTVRDFVLLLHVIYREAHRPTLRTISKAIRDSDYRATASTETVRRMLRGETIPANWETVEAVLGGLCELANWDPDGMWLYQGAESSAREHLLRAWHHALDAPDRFYFADEPPF